MNLENPFGVMAGICAAPSFKTARNGQQKIGNALHCGNHYDDGAVHGSFRRDGGRAANARRVADRCATELLHQESHGSRLSESSAGPGRPGLKTGHWNT